MIEKRKIFFKIESDSIVLFPVAVDSVTGSCEAVVCLSSGSFDAEVGFGVCFFFITGDKWLFLDSVLTQDNYNSIVLTVQISVVYLSIILYLTLLVAALLIRRTITCSR